MTPQQHQTRLAGQLRLFEDPQERLSFIQDRARKEPALPEVLRCEENRIQGCITRVWLHSWARGTRCSFRVDSESSMVRGLALLVCEVYSDCEAAEIAAFECTLLEEAGLHRSVTPTRLHGLGRLQDSIRSFARRIQEGTVPPSHTPSL